MSDDLGRAEGVSDQVGFADDKQDSTLGKMWDSLKKNKAAVLGLFLVIFLVLFATVGRIFMPYNPNLTEESAANPRSPSQSHIFGTDEHGRDIFSRVLDGAGISVFVGIVSVAFSLFFGIVLGAVAGYYGGKLDSIIMRSMDTMLAIPSILLAMSLMLALGSGIEKIIVAIGFVAIPQYARIIRGSVLSERETDYVKAAKIIGSSDSLIIFKGILPNIISGVVVRATLGISGAILELAALGFLGLGIQPPQAEWGTMLSESRRYILQAPHTLIFPGAAITLTVMAFNLLGDGLRDILDPKS
ncbi:MAG: ABC transporter permease [Oscillospiraceae bacterium]|jgi:peptide/nickel transport system permease protein|nr:ABC transporter permease [Oscillospiraceae bacterium]